MKQGFVLMKDLGSFGVDYEVNCVSKDVEQRIRKESELRKNIFDVFYENDVQVTYAPSRLGKMLQQFGN